MAITQDAHDDLSARLRALIAAYAPASDRLAAEAQIDTLLSEHIAISEDGADDGTAAQAATIAELRGQLEALREAGELGEHQLDQAKEAALDLEAQLVATKAELAQAHADLETATTPKTDV